SCASSVTPRLLSARDCANHIARRGESECAGDKYRGAEPALAIELEIAARLGFGRAGAIGPRENLLLLGPHAPHAEVQPAALFARGEAMRAPQFLPHDTQQHIARR